MSRPNLIFIFIIFSLFLHVFLFSFFHFNINSKATPLIYGWPGIISRSDLFFKTTKVELSSLIDFSLDSVRRDYFSERIISHPQSNPYPEFPVEQIPLSEDAIKTIKAGYYQSGPKSIYLWEKQTPFFSEEKEKMSFRAFVSPHGKVLFIYPEKLPVDSTDNLLFQEYIHKANLFLNDKFFWTKVEGIVK
ncbi:MAG: hypothetical protein JW867_09165 [Candidatus Omnitrophica bacterium]|nr:hypothetical protein [Candidatus Omnitrophota bacterium]